MSSPGGIPMAVARGDEGSGNTAGATSAAGHMARRRSGVLRKPAPVAGNAANAVTDAPAHTPAVPPNPTPVIASPPSTATSTRLDDLYRLPMPKLFAYAEREGIAEHTGMNRGQLIMAVVRRQIERGITVRGSGTLEVLPDGYGFLRSVAPDYLASPEDIYVPPRHTPPLRLKPALIVAGPTPPPL